MAAEWFYTHGMGQQRLGPVDKERLKQLASAGELTRQDLVWTVGMPQWTEAGTVAGLFDGVAAPTAPATSRPAAAPAAMASPVSGAPAEIDYRSAPVAEARDFPHRALANLQGHARPTGDTYHWPLNDMQVAQWDQSLKIRKKINSAAQLYRALLFLSAIGAAIFGLVWVFSMVGSSARNRNEMMFMIIPALLIGAFALLYYFAWRSTVRSQRWAPLTMFIIYTIGAVLNVLGIFAGMSQRPADQVASVGGAAFGIFLMAAFAVISWRAYAAIPEYLSQPAWCQELIVKAQL